MPGTVEGFPAIQHRFDHRYTETVTQDLPHPTWQRKITCACGWESERPIWTTRDNTEVWEDYHHHLFSALLDHTGFLYGPASPVETTSETTTP